MYIVFRKFCLIGYIINAVQHNSTLPKKLFFKSTHNILFLVTFSEMCKLNYVFISDAMVTDGVTVCITLRGWQNIRTVT